MQKLPPPVKRYLTGKSPTHSTTSLLHKNFKDLPQETFIAVFESAGYMDSEGKAQKKAVTDNLIDSCEKKALWNVSEVEKKLTEMGLKIQRAAMNQEIKEPDDGEPRWVNLGTIGTYFNVTANTIGKWLTELNLRDNDSMGSQEAIDKGLVTVSEMNAGGKKTRKIAMWNLYPVKRVLLEAGHYLDFDYDKLLTGSGKNSDVKVSTLDDRAKDFAKEFVTTFKNPDTRRECIKMVKAQPQPILKKAETILKKPGFLTKETYKKYIK